MYTNRTKLQTVHMKLQVCFYCDYNQDILSQATEASECLKTNNNNACIFALCFNF